MKKAFKKGFKILQIILLSLCAGLAISIGLGETGINVSPLVTGGLVFLGNMIINSAIGFSVVFKYIPTLAYIYMRLRPDKKLVMTNFGMTPLNDDENENPGGLKVVGYWIPRKHITAYPTMTPYDDITTDTQSVVLNGNYTLAVGKFFIPVYNTMDTSEITSTAVGEPDGKSYEHQYDGFIPGLFVEMLAFARKMISTKGVFIRVTVDGERLVVGSEDFPAIFIEGKHTTGKATADRRGFTYTIKSKGIGPTPMYKGTIILSGSTLPAIS